MKTSEMIEPRIAVINLALERKYLEAARFLVEARATHGALPDDLPLGEALTDLAVDATTSGEHAQVVGMIDDPDIRPHLRADFLVWRSAFAKVAAQSRLSRMPAPDNPPQGHS